jgi:hypothetical protein
MNDFIAGLDSCARTVASAVPEMRLRVFRNVATEAAGWVRINGIDKRIVVEKLFDIAVANHLVKEHGDDVVQEIMAAALIASSSLPVAASKSRVATPNGSRSVERMKASCAPSATLVFDVVAEVDAQAIGWTWPGRLARRKLTLIAGDPGLGKSQITADIAARISTGSDWPDGGAATAGSTIILSAEDGVADTLRPRLEVAGANLHRIHVKWTSNRLLTRCQEIFALGGCFYLWLERALERASKR